MGAVKTEDASGPYIGGANLTAITNLEYAKSEKNIKMYIGNKNKKITPISICIF